MKYLGQKIRTVAKDQLRPGLRFQIRYPVLRLMTLLVMAGILFVASPAMAQDGIGGAFEGIITSLTELIQNITLGVGLLGIVLWGFGKVARPIFPEISQMTAQYFNQFIIGIVVVFAATEIVDMVAGAVGGS